ncbi:tetratricopeptide repeat protein [Allorhizobium sp. BGMRC 0089]|uniref:tetratricopeptide repeat protein n=1 Tax=Allorhizobium sonneratiae TaxID=2934936 RepID=UPI002033744A|nr:tetratricopeptide repeat protein [Allorhizobium sonneratiae]MCM2293790.1 tetratricopeptide repeat protein [Allorhizobium sonneratiae]
MAAAILILAAGAGPVFAAAPTPQTTTPALNADELQVRNEWEKLKFTLPEGTKQTQLMNRLGQIADQLPVKYPNDPAAYIWDGIITSERASMASMFSALGLAKQAKALLEKAYAMDPKALDAGAATSLAVLYYRVPGFPIGFGDVNKARALLQQAVQIAPNNLDAEYFYGDFLVGQHEYAHARQVLTAALAIPVNPDRPLWDNNRRLVIQHLLNTIKDKT